MSGLLYEITYICEAIPFQATAEMFELASVPGSPEVLAEATMIVDDLAGKDGGQGNTVGLSMDHSESFYGRAAGGVSSLLAHGDKLTNALKKSMKFYAQYKSDGPAAALMSAMSDDLKGRSRVRTTSHFIEYCKSIQLSEPEAWSGMLEWLAHQTESEWETTSEMDFKSAEMCKPKLLRVLSKFRR
jgi:hypothetical protein